MQLDNMKMLLAGAWVLIMGVAGYLLNPSSAISWAVLAALTIIPVVAVWRFRNPAQTLSESINEARRR